MKNRSIIAVAAALLAASVTGRCDPNITSQPQSRTNVAGTTANFTVDASDTFPLFYQWQKNLNKLLGETNTMLVLTNVQTGSAGGYRVVVTNSNGGAVTSDTAILTIVVPPTILTLVLGGQPATLLDSPHPYLSNSASLGANLILSATASGTFPLHYQWQWNQTDLPGQTRSSLTLNNMQLTNAGDYTLVVTNQGGMTNRTLTLGVDGTFTKITAGPMVTSIGYSSGGTWFDYDDDGWLDLFVYNGTDGSGTPQDAFLYRNNGDGTFTPITTAPPVNFAAQSYSACAGDYDNDGKPDLFVATTGVNLLYHNEGGGVFTRVTRAGTGGIILDSANTFGAAWGDYNSDGLLDLLVTTFDPAASSHNFLYRNKGDGTFTSINNSVLVTDLGSSLGCVWQDYDGDGRLDLFVCGGSGPASGTLQPNRLYHNNGNGTFTRVLTGSIAADRGYSGPAAWGDYDNDGFPDLFVANAGGLKNFLYHNNGDGTFTKITNGSPVNEFGDGSGCSWVDYDNDGFLDLFAARGVGEGNYLYHNNGNSNGWLTVKLVGTVSNRSAIGAKVRVKAFYRGATRWQLREISGGSGWVGHNELQANFGLGDATNINLVCIEWPSGTVQELSNVAMKQILTVTEPPRLTVTNAANALLQLVLKGGRGLSYDLQASTNFVD